jgi:antitoxin HicB
MLRYPMHLEAAEEGGFIISFPDIPEAHSQAEDEVEAVRRGTDALETALEIYFEDRRPIPAPSKPLRGQRLIELPAGVTAKVLLLNELIAQKVRPAELARRLKVTPQEVTRLIDVHHTTKIDGIAVALKALGKTLEMRVV